MAKSAPQETAFSTKALISAIRRSFANGPISTLLLIPFPTTVAAARSTYAAVNSSKMGSWTKKRVGDVQT